MTSVQLLLFMQDMFIHYPSKNVDIFSIGYNYPNLFPLFYFKNQHEIDNQQSYLSYMIQTEIKWESIYCI